VLGSSSDDVILGQAGNDQVSGNGGADMITDFLSSSGDKINVSLIDANTTNRGNDAFSFIGSGAFSHVAGDLRYNVVGSDLYLRGDMNGDGVADLVIRLLGVGSVAGTDFIL
jgi:hypothetical protein